MLEGQIKLTSEKGVGSEFIIEIPLKSAADVPNAIEKTSKNESHDLKHISVFVIEDDPIQLKMATTMIKNKGMHCMGVTDTDEVLLYLRNNIFDIIFVDINLQAANGVELIKEIYETDKKLLKDIPVIALSAASDITKDELLLYGFTDFLPKPFTSEGLYGMINTHVKSGEIVSERKKESVTGLMSLIEYVNDDVEKSSEILHSFIKETSASNELLEEAFKQNDYILVRKTSHKMLPLIKMIG